jgi:hypothetical protein
MENDLDDIGITLDEQGLSYWQSALELRLTATNIPEGWDLTWLERFAQHYLKDLCRHLEVNYNGPVGHAIRQKLESIAELAESSVSL